MKVQNLAANKTRVIKHSALLGKPLQVKFTHNDIGVILLKDKGSTSRLVRMPSTGLASERQGDMLSPLPLGGKYDLLSAL